MRKTFFAALFVAFLMPSVAVAEDISIRADIHSFVSSILSNVNTSASATGGAVVSGQVVSTGDQEARSTIRNIVKNEGGTEEIHVDIQTEVDGEVKRETIREKVEAKKPFHVTLGTSSSDGTTRAWVRIIGNGSAATSTLHASSSKSFFNWFKNFPRFEAHSTTNADIKVHASSSKILTGESTISTWFRWFVNGLPSLW